MAVAVYTGINRCLVPWAPYLGPGNGWIENNSLNEPYDLPEAIDDPSSLKKRYDDIVGMMSEWNIAGYYDLSKGQDVTNDDFYNPTADNGPRKFSSLRGVDLAGWLDDPYGEIPSTGPIAFKGDQL